MSRFSYKVISDNIRNALLTMKTNVELLIKNKKNDNNNNKILIILYKYMCFMLNIIIIIVNCFCIDDNADDKIGN